MYSFPDNLGILAMPDDTHIEGSHLSYKATYVLEENILKVNKIFDDRTPDNMCEPELIRKQREILQKVIRNIKSQVVYKVHD